MPAQISIAAIVKGALVGVVKAQKAYADWSCGDWPLRNKKKGSRKSMF